MAPWPLWIRHWQVHLAITGDGSYVKVELTDQVQKSGESTVVQNFRFLDRELNSHIHLVLVVLVPVLVGATIFKKDKGSVASNQIVTKFGKILVQENSRPTSAAKENMADSASTDNGAATIIA